MGSLAALAILSILVMLYYLPRIPRLPTLGNIVGISILFILVFLCNPVSQSLHVVIATRSILISLICLGLGLVAARLQP